jgi:hypothetical protein
VAALGASVAMTEAAERTSALTSLKNSIQMMMTKIMAPEGDPISPPTPTAKPERPSTDQTATKEKPGAPSVIAQCGYASIVSTLAADGQTPIFRARFADGMIDEMANEGCAQFYQGCNVCSVQYLGCDDAVKAACTDAACLEAKCERTVLCSAKRCEARGKPGGNVPSCKSRLMRTACIRQTF